eukprot:TRINITY_DN3_c0_g2_i1.p1 TRINITY_DN3_c0_g2~~TRINITY_DN3_c0_g2_i1.p1  ORF type:complete len:364 (+),score=75.60 TRINITY_DN3_c0_g2_i1:32-1093(+)
MSESSQNVTILQEKIDVVPYIINAGIFVGSVFTFFAIQKYVFGDGRDIQKPTWNKVEKKKKLRSRLTLESLWAGEIPSQMRDVYNILRNPDLYLKYNVDLPKGIILYGKPGTGKTHFAKVLSYLTNSNFFYISASAFDEIYVGQGSQRVRRLFEEARDSLRQPTLYDKLFGKPKTEAKTAIIFIDEIDSLGNRDNISNSSYSTLSELLTCMDGIGSTPGIFVIGATNKLESIDPALRRSGRFDRVCKVDLPSAESRASLLKHFWQDKPGFFDNIYSNEEYFLTVVERTKGFSIADMKNFTNEATYCAIRDTISNGGSETEVVPLEKEHIEEALSLLLKKLITEKTRKRKRINF